MPLNAKIYEFSDYAIEVIHEPAYNLSLDLQDELVAECTEVSREGFGNSNIKEEFVRHCILNSSTTLFARDHKVHLVGYSSNNLEIIGKYYVIYLQATAMLTTFQGKGMRNTLFPIKVLEDIRKLENIGVEPCHILLATRTQNRVVPQ